MMGPRRGEHLNWRDDADPLKGKLGVHDPHCKLELNRTPPKLSKALA